MEPKAKLQKAKKKKKTFHLKPNNSTVKTDNYKTNPTGLSSTYINYGLSPCMSQETMIIKMKQIALEVI